MQPAIVPEPGRDPVRVAVVIASLGRPEILGRMLGELVRQSRPADRIILSVVSQADLPADIARFPVEIVQGAKGSCVQRNTGLDRVGTDCDLIFFCDDDYVPSNRAIEQIVALFAANPDIAGTTGHLLADGVNSPGISFDEALAMVEAYDRRDPPPAVVYRDLAGLYGCNMAFRASAIGDVRFDERLRLYGWQEDIDFSMRVRPRGRIVKTFAFAGVHCGVKAGRSPGVRIGYSQVVNPVYLVGKGTMSRRYALRIVWRNILANHVRSFGAEPWVDRLGRMRGNWIGLFDVMRGRVTPERVERL